MKLNRLCTSECDNEHDVYKCVWCISCTQVCVVYIMYTSVCGVYHVHKCVWCISCTQVCVVYIMYTSVCGVYHVHKCVWCISCTQVCVVYIMYTSVCGVYHVYRCAGYMRIMSLNSPHPDCPPPYSLTVTVVCSNMQILYFMFATHQYMCVRGHLFTKATILIHTLHIVGCGWVWLGVAVCFYFCCENIVFFSFLLSTHTIHSTNASTHTHTHASFTTLILYKPIRIAIYMSIHACI